MDEKSQVQALDRTAPILPGVPEKQTHDYVRNGTTTLLAALEVATGRVEQACLPRHRHQEFLRFLTRVAKAYPRKKLHIVCDNYATHKHPAVKAWLARNPRITLHFTPTSGSWLNMVEIFFGIITRQAIRRGTHRSVRELIDLGDALAPHPGLRPARPRMGAHLVRGAGTPESCGGWLVGRARRRAVRPHQEELDASADQPAGDDGEPSALARAIPRPSWLSGPVTRSDHVLCRAPLRASAPGGSCGTPLTAHPI